MLAQIAAEELGVPIERVTVRFHDTDDVASGFGSFASRSTTWPETRSRSRRAQLRAARGEAALGDSSSRRARYEKAHPSYSFGAALSVVSVDRGDRPGARAAARRRARRRPRGQSRARARAARRRGRAGDRGSALRGAPLRRERQRRSRSRSRDYLIPTAAELPDGRDDRDRAPASRQPYGRQGRRRSRDDRHAGAVANAVAAALGPAGAGVDRLPLTPSRVRALVREAESSSGSSKMAPRSRNAAPAAKLDVPTELQRTVVVRRSPAMCCSAREAGGMAAARPLLRLSRRSPLEGLGSTASAAARPSSQPVPRTRASRGRS